MDRNGTTGSIVLLGSSGMLGQELLSVCEPLGGSFHAFADSEALDVSNRSAVLAAMASIRPTVILNATAYTNVDGAETEREKASRVNGDGPRNLAEAARIHGALLVHYSTDYVFSGEGRRPYAVCDPESPVNWYGESKLRGERAVREVGCRHLILRTSWLYAPHGRNFVQTILHHARTASELKVVTDQRGRPTLAADLARMTCQLIRCGVEGTFHVANSGDCSWFEFAGAIVDEAGFPCRIIPVETREFPRPAHRPQYSVLDLSKTASMLGQPRHWRDALSECMRIILNDHVPSASSAVRAPSN